jgi:hypothetical protein
MPPTTSADRTGTAGARLLNGCGNRVANTSSTTALGAIRYGGNEHLIELNEIYGMCSLLWTSA